MPIYMKYEGVKGDVTAKGHEGWIELQTCQIGVNRRVTNPTGQGVNREANVPSFSEIVISKEVDNSSNGLFQASFGAGKKVTIDFIDKDGAIYLTLQLENTLISSYSISGHGGTGHDNPMESLSLNFTKIEYKAQTPPKDPKHAMNSMEWKLAISQMA